MSKKKIIILSSMLLVLLLILGVCWSIYNKPNKIQKYMLGAVITIPDKAGFEATLTSVDGDNLKGVIKDSKTGKASGGEVIAYVNQIKTLSNNLTFIVPFEVSYGANDKYTYLDMFYLDNPSTNNEDLFHKSMILLSQYMLGKNVSLANINIGTVGTYSIPVSLEYYDINNTKNDLALRFYYETKSLVIYQTCDKIGSIVNREKGDGKKYDVCVFDDSHECTLGAYEKGDCPVGGYDVSAAKTPAEKYGTANGFLFKNGTFVFPANYAQCTIDDFYSGKCEMK